MSANQHYSMACHVRSLDAGHNNNPNEMASAWFEELDFREYTTVDGLGERENKTSKVNMLG